MKKLLCTLSCCLCSMVLADAELDLILLNDNLIALNAALQQQQTVGTEQPMRPSAKPRRIPPAATFIAEEPADVKAMADRKKEVAAEEKKIIAGMAVARPVALTREEIKQRVDAGTIVVAQPTQPAYRAADAQPERALPEHMLIAAPVTAETPQAAVRPNRQRMMVQRVAAAHQQKRRADQRPDQPAQLVETKVAAAEPAEIKQAAAAEVKQQVAALPVAQPVAQVVMQPAAVAAQPTAEVKKEIDAKRIAVAAPVVQPAAPAKKPGFFSKLFGR